MARSATAIVRRDSPGGRGAPERILRAAGRLFDTHGVAGVDVSQLIVAADVSRRSFYTHFADRAAVHDAYLGRLAAVPADTPLGALQAADRTPRQRLSDLFDPGRCPPHGCPFSNATTIAHDPGSPAHVTGTEFKRRIADELTQLARDAGVRDPETLARRLSLIFNGAILETAIFSSHRPLHTARELARELFDAAERARPQDTPGPTADH